MITAVIIDDELNNANYLQGLVEAHVPEVQLKGIAGNLTDALKLINEVKPSLVFLDIELQTATGFDLLSRIEKIDFSVIFTTAHEHYALKAIKFAALDFLLKPVDSDQLKEAVNKAIVQTREKTFDKHMSVFMENLQKQKGQKKIAISTSSSLLVMEIKDLIYLQADGPYTHIHSQYMPKITSSKNLKEYEELLDEHDFFRIHKSYLVNLAEIKQYAKSDGGYVIMSNGDKVYVSDKKKEELITRMASHVIFIK